MWVSIRYMPMKIHLLKYVERLRTSFWFLPTLMTLGSAALAYAMVALDRHLSHELPEAFDWAYTGGAEGASSVLSAIAGSMITLAGVVFSLTLVALSLASSQFGPRLLRNFMRDTTNQITIGTFVATFMYCLLVLRTIRRIEEATFVPELSVTVGVGFALVSIGVLIYFIHHVAVSIQADEIIARVSGELSESIERMFPDHLGKNAVDAESPPLPDDFDTESVAVEAQGDGYLEFVDAGALMRLAEAHDLVLRIERRPGHYAIDGTTMLFAYPGTRVDAALAKKLREAFVLGARTAAQDVEFSLNQLVEIAVRALSPGVNDPFTAITCVDRLGSAFSRVVQRQLPSAYRLDEHDRLRVIAPATTFPDLLAAGFNQIRQNGAANVAVTIRLLEILAQIGAFAHRDADINALQHQADMIVHASRRLPNVEQDRGAIDERYALVGLALARRSSRSRALSRTHDETGP